MKPVSEIENYHAHVYYDAACKPAAVALRQVMEEEFPGAVFGRWHDRPVGPHPDWSFQIAFKADLFQPIVSYLALNRGRLLSLSIRKPVTRSPITATMRSGWAPSGRLISTP